jgi:hypothetical protein
MSTIALRGAADSRRSVFAGADVCREAGLTLPDGARRPVFDDDFWDFSEVIGLPNQMAMVSRRFGFTVITDTRWRLVAKEQIMAMLAPRHEAVAPLPRAYRTPLHLMTAFGRLAELTRFLNCSAGASTGTARPAMSARRTARAAGTRGRSRSGTGRAGRAAASAPTRTPVIRSRPSSRSSS